MAESQDGALSAILTRYEAGQLSPEIALMELLIACEDEQRVERALAERTARAPSAQLARIARLFADNRAGCAEIAAILRSEEVGALEAPSEALALARCRALFDGLVLRLPEASVALYSLGNPEILAAATREIVAQLAQLSLLGPHVRALDFGCGIGRVAEALAPHVAELRAVDLSPEMVLRAEARCRAHANVQVALSSGRDLADLASGSRELVLAVDSFPYVVLAGEALVSRLFAEFARVLVPGGSLVLLNYSYRGDLARDRDDVRAVAPVHGFSVERCGEQPFRLWNGSLFTLRRG